MKIMIDNLTFRLYTNEVPKVDNIRSTGFSVRAILLHLVKNPVEVKNE